MVRAILSATISLREVFFRIEMKATFCGLSEREGVLLAGEGVYFGGTCFLLL